jgi:MFS family permease
MAGLHKKPDALSTLSAAEKAVELERNGDRPVSRQLLYCAWIANFASWLAISEIRVLFPKLGLDLGMQPWVIGIIIFSLGIALTVMFFVMAAFGRWHNKVAPLLCAQALIVVLLLASIKFESPMMLGLIFAGLGIGFGVTYSYSLYCSVVGSLNKGAASGRHEMVLGTGALMGPLIGGAAIQVFAAPRAPYAFAAGLLVVCMIAEVIILLRGRAR